MENARRFREGMTRAGFRIRPGFHPIVPVMLSGRGRDEAATRGSRKRWRRRCWARGSTSSASRTRSCPRGQARIRVQLSAAHTPAMVDRAVDAFTRVGKRFELV